MNVYQFVCVVQSLLIFREVWDSIVLTPDHCLSSYFVLVCRKTLITHSLLCCAVFVTVHFSLSDSQILVEMEIHCR